MNVVIVRTEGNSLYFIDKWRQRGIQDDSDLLRTLVGNTLETIVIFAPNDSDWDNAEVWEALDDIDATSDLLYHCSLHHDILFGLTETAGVE
jgi:hypothetical protein